MGHVLAKGATYAPHAVSMIADVKRSYLLVLHYHKGIRNFSLLIDAGGLCDMCVCVCACIQSRSSFSTFNRTIHRSRRRRHRFQLRPPSGREGRGGGGGKS
jgi:hypothetical protein